MRARAAEAGDGGEDDRPGLSPFECLELAALGDGRLVDMAADDQLRARAGQGREHVVSRAEWPLAGGPPGRRGEVVVESDDAKGSLGGLCELRRGAPKLVDGESASLLAPGPDGVEADDDQVVRAEDGLGFAEHLVPALERAREARRRRIGDVVVARNRQDWEADAVEQGARALELLGSPAIREVARREDEVGPELGGERDERIEGLGGVALADVNVGEVENPLGHRRGRLYTWNVAEGSPEIFDDLYLGMRAGGAMRKQRRGEELTAEEQEALSHWQRLGMLRKTAAVGAFALGTFGLGFTLGGLVFGRWRKA